MAFVGGRSLSIGGTNSESEEMELLAGRSNQEPALKRPVINHMELVIKYIFIFQRDR